MDRGQSDTLPQATAFQCLSKPDKVVTAHPCLPPSPRTPQSPQQTESLHLCPQHHLHRAWHANWGPPDQVGVCGVKTSVMITAHIWGIFTCSPGSVLSLQLR